MKRVFGAALAVVLGVMLCGQALAAAKTEITWYGQSAFKVKTPSGGVLLIDPWINNPKNPNAAKDLAALDKVGYILVTHAHRDHIGDSAEIAKKTGAKLVANADLGRAMVQFGGFPEQNTDRALMGSFGGEMSLFGGEVTVHFVPAVHGSTIEVAADSPLAGKAVGAGQAGGMVIVIKDGPTIYHTGDTDLFLDMALIGQEHKVDVMMACMGGHFTMGPTGAAKAAILVQAKLVIPMHFGTFPLLAGTPEQLRQALSALPVKGQKPRVVELAVGQTWVWPE